MSEQGVSLQDLGLIPEPKPLAEARPEQRPIDLLVPESAIHKALLDHLKDRLKSSEDRMGQFHKRWQVNERRYMAYLNMTDFEKLLSDSNKAGNPPSSVSIVVPYSYATVWTIVTYLIHTFCGRKPIFQVGSYSKESVEPARYMETLLQFNADHSKLVRKIFQWMMDGQIYGLGVVRTLWRRERGRRTMWTSGSPLGAFAPDLAQQLMRQTKDVVVYEGNEVTCIDPFMFFPDPRVPIEEVSRRGEYVFWRSFEGIHSLRKAEARGELKWIDAIGRRDANRHEATGSVRDLITDGEAHPGAEQRDTKQPSYHQVDQGTIEIIPSEWGIGDGTDYEKWLFTIVNKNQIVQAEPLDYDHDRHPVSVIEPYSIGYAFGQASIVDMLGPIQDVLSWFVNSHMHNVRTAINNMLIVDPAFVEMQDLKTPGPGKIIRLKPSAIGRDVKTVLNQLAVQDVTANHISDMQNFMRLGDILSATNDNLRGVQEAGGRKTATEVRTAGESGASRLASLARLISAQGMTDLAEQMSINIQQLQTQEFYLQIVGSEGAAVPIHPAMAAGEFYYPVHDGTLPLDRIALLDIWKEIWMAVSTNPQLSMTYNGPKIFEYVAELGGAKNLSSFRVDMAPEGAIPPNGVPIGLPGINPRVDQPAGTQGPANQAVNGVGQPTYSGPRNGGGASPFA